MEACFAAGRLAAPRSISRIVRAGFVESARCAAPLPVLLTARLRAPVSGAAPRPPPQRENIYTVPNLLTISRLAVTPYIGFLIVAGDYTPALGWAVVAGASDVLDGWIARQFPSQASTVGGVIDPIADKVLVGTTVVTMTYAGLLPAPLAAIVLLRDGGLFLASFYIRYQSLRPHVDTVTWRTYWDFSLPSATVTPTAISKVNTAVQLAAVYFSLAAPVYGFTDHAALQALWGFAGATTILSGASYVFSKNAVVFIKPSK